jgi:hypothetical protein
MMNSEFTGKAAREMAAIVQAEYPDDRAKQIGAAFLRVTQREISPEDLRRLMTAVDDWQKSDSLTEDQAMQQLCLLLLNLNEFVYLD